jgi:hypothetical protein
MPPAARLNLVRFLSGTEGELCSWRSRADTGETVFEDVLLLSRSTAPFAAGATSVGLEDLVGTFGEEVDFNAAVFDVPFAALDVFGLCLVAVAYRRELTLHT